MPTNIYNTQDAQGDTSPQAAYLQGLRRSEAVYRYPADLGARSTVENTPFVVFAPYKRKRQLLSVNPSTTLNTLPTPEFNVVLPLPSSALKTQYGVVYAPVTLGTQLGAGVSTFSNKPGADQQSVEEFSTALKGGSILKKLGDSAFKSFLQSAEEAALNVVTSLSFGDADATKEALFGLAGQRYNPYTENLFKDVAFREHEFSYVFHPRNLKESQTVDNIVRLLRFFMLPAYSNSDLLGDAAELSGAEGAVLNFPYEFQILYSVHDTTFMLLPSVLTDVSLDYSGGTDSPQFFTAKGRDKAGKNYPASIAMTLKFKEMMMLTRNRLEVDDRVATYDEDPEGGNATGNYTRFRF